MFVIVALIFIIRDDELGDWIPAGCCVKAGLSMEAQVPDFLPYFYGGSTFLGSKPQLTYMFACVSTVCGHCCISIAVSTLNVMLHEFHTQKLKHNRIGTPHFPTWV